MKAADRLSHALGSHISESMGGKRAGRELASNPFPDGPVVHGGPGAEKYRGAARLKDAFAISLDRIARDPNQPRKEFDQDDLDRLAASMKSRGQLQPIRVRYDDSTSRWMIISGERRYRAALLAGLTTLICVEAKGSPTAEDVLEDQVVENCVREDLKPIEQARAFKTLLEMRSCSYRHLAESLNISHQAVVRALALLELPAQIQEKVDAGIVPASSASELARLRDVGEQFDITARIESGDMTRDDVSRTVKARIDSNHVKKSKGPKTKSQSPIDARPKRATNRVKIRIEATPKHSIADVVAALREIADRLEETLLQEEVA
jgi:ParB family transcriptional regulator, chromosome partitioning protein